VPVVGTILKEKRYRAHRSRAPSELCRTGDGGDGCWASRIRSGPRCATSMRPCWTDLAVISIRRAMATARRSAHQAISKANCSRRRTSVLGMDMALSKWLEQYAWTNDSDPGAQFPA